MGESAVLVGKFSLIRHQAQLRYRRLFNDYFPTTRQFFGEYLLKIELREILSGSSLLLPINGTID